MRNSHVKKIGSKKLFCTFLVLIKSFLLFLFLLYITVPKARPVFRVFKIKKKIFFFASDKNNGHKNFKKSQFINLSIYRNAALLY